MIVATEYTASIPFTIFSLWGGDFFACVLDATEEFEVIIWDEDPSIGGNIVFQQTLNGSTTDTGEEFLNTSIYQIDIDLGVTISQLSGFIGITRNNATCDPGFGFAWLADDSGNGNVIQSSDGSSWTTPSSSDLFFCLSYEEPVAVPITNWALYITAILIGVFFIFRIRRII